MANASSVCGWNLAARRGQPHLACKRREARVAQRKVHVSAHVVVKAEKALVEEPEEGANVTR